MRQRAVLKFPKFFVREINCFFDRFLILLGRRSRSDCARFQNNYFWFQLARIVNVFDFTAIRVRLNNTHAFGHCIIFSDKEVITISPPTPSSPKVPERQRLRDQTCCLNISLPLRATVTGKYQNEPEGQVKKPRQINRADFGKLKFKPGNQNTNSMRICDVFTSPKVPNTI